MAGMSTAAQMLGLPGQGDVTADEQKRKQKEAQSPLTAMLASAGTLLQGYGNAARELLGAPQQAANAVENIQATAAADPKKLKKTP